MPVTNQKIATVTVGAAGAANIDFTGIPQTFTDLKVVLSARSSVSNWADNIRVAINGSSSNFTRRSIYAESGTAGSEVGTIGNLVGLLPGTTSTANTFGILDIYIPNYTVTANKTFWVDSTSENNSSTSGMWIVAGLWSSTSAITQLTLTNNSTSNFLQYSTATLYGINNL
jgi:hypothetical protein